MLALIPTIALLGPAIPGPYVEIEAGAQFTCVRNATGNVACWGDNDRGQLGARPGGARSTAQAVPGLGDVVQLAAGYNQICALRRNGRLECWGDDVQGAFAWAEALRDVRQVALTADFGCALHATAEVSCWGDLPGRRGASGPERLPVTGITELVGGYHSICARQTSGAVWCWGEDARELLGLSEGETADAGPLQLPGGSARAVYLGDQTLCQVTAAGALRCRKGDAAMKVGVDRVDHMDFGVYHGCALGAGQLQCWGALLPSPARLVSPAQPIRMPLDDVSAVAIGSGHGCAIHAGRTRVSCWGRNQEGQLGDGVPLFWGTPTLVPGIEGAVELRSRHHSTCVRFADGRLTCWGGSQCDRTGPYAPMSGATGLVEDGASACALTRDGSVRCWRSEDHGPARSRIEEDELPPNTHWQQVVEGEDYRCGIETAGRLVCWGKDHFGVLGGPPKHDERFGQHALPAVPAVVQIVGGEVFTCARTKSGAVWCWGSMPLLERIPPTRIPGSAVHLAATDGAACAERRDGTIWCWGELGYGDEFSKGRTPKPIPGLRGVKHLRGGVHHLCGVRAGKAVCWGDNAGGQLGTGDRQPKTKPVTVRLPRPVTQVAPSFRHTCALDDRGRPWCWGENGQGAALDDRRVTCRTPKPVTGL